MSTEHQDGKPQLPELPRVIEQMKLFISLKTLEAKLSGIAKLQATYTPQEW